MSDKPLRVAPTHGIEHRAIARLTDLYEKVCKELQEATTDLSTARQSLYEVVEQRNTFISEVKSLRRFASCHYMHMDGFCVKCGFPGHATFDKEET